MNEFEKKLIQQGNIDVTPKKERIKDASTLITGRREQSSRNLLDKYYAKRGFELVWDESNPALPMFSPETVDTYASTHKIDEAGTLMIQECLEKNMGFTLGQVSELIRQARIQYDEFFKEIIGDNFTNEFKDKVFSDEIVNQYPLAFALFYKQINNLFGATKSKDIYESEVNPKYINGIYAPMTLSNETSIFFIGQRQRDVNIFKIIKRTFVSPEIDETCSKFIVLPKNIS